MEKGSERLDFRSPHWPTHHRSALRLATKFNEIDDIEANYQLNHHEYYQKQEVERTNAINELITRIHISNWDSRATYAENQSSESRFGTFTIWHYIRKGLIATIAIMFTLILIILTVITFLRARTLKTRRRFERYADQLEENRRLLLKDTLERKRAEERLSRRSCKWEKKKSSELMYFRIKQK